MTEQQTINGLIYGLGVALPIVLIAIFVTLWFVYWNKSNSATVTPPIVQTVQEPEKKKEKLTYPNLFIANTSINDFK